MSVAIYEKMVEQIQLADVIAQRAEKLAAAKEATDKKVADLVPQVVDALVKNHRIPDDARTREKCASLLGDHVHALEILANTAKHRNAEEASHMGTSTGNGTQKKASAPRGGLDSPFVGGKTTDERDSDRILFERLGLR